MGLMSSDDSKLKNQFTDIFKRQVRDLPKPYRQIKVEIQPVLDHDLTVQCHLLISG